MPKNSFFCRLLFLLFLAAFALPSVTPALAQSYFGMIWGNSITGEDFKQLEDATNTLLKRTPLSRGASESWRNDRSGAHGTIRVQNTFRYKGLLCHKIFYQISPSGAQTTRDLQLSWCNTSDGEWKIL
jgi:surface antigen